MSLRDFTAPTTLIKTVASTATPERISATRLPAKRVILIGCKAAQTDNATTIYIGPASANGAQVIPIASGGQYALENVDLFDWYIDVGTNGDGVIAVYW